MAGFSYSARNRAGIPVRGMVDEGSAEAALARLRAACYTDIALSAATSAPSVSSPPPFVRTCVAVPTRALAQFYRQMASMARAGIPAVQALRSVNDTTRDTALRRAAADMEIAAERGRPVSEAMERHPEAFRRGHVGLVRFGEGAGRLPEAYAALAAQAEADWAVEGATRMNPLLFCVRWFLAPVVAVAAVAALPVLLHPFSGGQSAFGAAAAAVVLLSLVGLGGFSVYPALIAVAKRTPRWAAVEEALFRLPGVGARRTRQDRVRVVEALASALDAGVPLAMAWSLAADAPDSDRFRSRMQAQTRRLYRAQPLSDCMMATALFPQAIVEAARNGELTGDLPAALRHATRYDQEEAALVGQLTPWVLGTLAYVLYLIVGSYVVLALHGAMCGTAGR